ncbi:hypothetical protein GCM10007052_19930 [Halioglobus japonicus]|nr:hypothetical protein GCM10007052_19930 [Halioglobus japonicus]
MKGATKDNGSGLLHQICELTADSTVIDRSPSANATQVTEMPNTEITNYRGLEAV